MKTYFAPAEKATKDQLTDEISFISQNPVMEGLLRSISGLLAILDENRQIIAVNDSFLKMLGVDDAATTMGLRPGEALKCIHAQDEPAGCGTTKYCSTCGAAVAIVTSLSQDEPVERICALSVNNEGESQDMALLVQSHPIIIENQKYILLFLQDISQEERRAALERTFFHDISNILSMLVGVSELLDEENPSQYTKIILDTSLRLCKEVEIQRCLSDGTPSNYKLTLKNSTTQKVLEEIELFFTNHPVGYEKNLDILKESPDIPIKTDMALLLRVLYNMIINAMEATAKNDTVRVWIKEEKEGCPSFNVWNSQEISQDVSTRIFQRNFTTKEQAGRGLGTYSMKFFGEKLLGGQVNFSTSKEEGTVFRFTLRTED